MLEPDPVPSEAHTASARSSRCTVSSVLPPSRPGAQTSGCSRSSLLHRSASISDVGNSPDRQPGGGRRRLRTCTPHTRLRTGPHSNESNPSAEGHGSLPALGLYDVDLNALGRSSGASALTPGCAPLSCRVDMLTPSSAPASSIPARGLWSQVFLHTKPAFTTCRALRDVHILRVP